MKKIKSLIAVTFFLLAISTIAQTTETEYNYITKGYKIQKESGLDMKKGYEFKDIKGWGKDFVTFKRTATFKHLYRDGEKVPCATLMILERSDTQYIAYVCIPHYLSNDIVWDKAYKGFNEATDGWNDSASAYTWGMVKMISYLSSEIKSE